MLQAQQVSSSMGTQAWPPSGLWVPNGGMIVYQGMIHWVMRQ